MGRSNKCIYSYKITRKDFDYDLLKQYTIENRFDNYVQFDKTDYKLAL